MYLQISYSDLLVFFYKVNFICNSDISINIITSQNRHLGIGIMVVWFRKQILKLRGLFFTLYFIEVQQNKIIHLYSTHFYLLFWTAHGNYNLRSFKKLSRHLSLNISIEDCRSLEVVFSFSLTLKGRWLF